MEFHRGRLIDHLHLVVADLAASKRFYRAVLQALGRDIEVQGDHFFYSDELFVSDAVFIGGSGRSTHRVHLALQASDRNVVSKFHEAALAAGGRDNGAPGERPYHPGYYAAFVLDPDGNNVEAVHHGPVERSADSVVLTTPG